jgi:predicted DsbA family dithiol-disulfide isomerase
LVLLAGIVALSGAGAWISGELVKQHANIWGSGGGPSGFFTHLCHATERVGFSCAGALNSRWSQIQIPLPRPAPGPTLTVRPIIIPVAFLSLAYFLFMAVWFAFLGRPRPYGRRWHRIPLAVGSCSVVISLFYLGLMALGVAPWCLWCLSVHLINFLMVYAIWRLRPGASLTDAAAAAFLSGHTFGLTLTTRQVASVVAFSLILVAGLWLHRREQLAFGRQLHKLLPYSALVNSVRNDPEFLLREYYAQPMHAIPPRSSEPVADDRPQLVVFTDFECPACYCASRAVRKQVTKAFAGRLTVLLRHYPLCKACNGDVKDDLHPNACNAAYAAEAARLQGGEEAFGKMQELLFRHGRHLGRELYRDLAARIGLEPDLLLRDMESEAVRQIVASDIELAKMLGVTGTPTMFLNGRRISEICEGPVFWKTVAKVWAPADDAAAATAGAPRALTVSVPERTRLD